MVGVQQMVRATCLQVMGAPPGQLAEYRREVLELHALIQGFRQDVAELKQQQSQQQVFPPSSPSIQSNTGSVTGFESEETVLDDANDMVLRVTWEEPPTRSWYEGRPLPLFNVRLDAENGGGAAPDGIRLRASFLNGRGGVEETKANGTSALVAGERYAYVVSGRAVWEQLVVCEASSKHYGSFTILIDAVEVTLSGLDLAPTPALTPTPTLILTLTLTLTLTLILTLTLTRCRPTCACASCVPIRCRCRWGACGRSGARRTTRSHPRTRSTRSLG